MMNYSNYSTSEEGRNNWDETIVIINCVLNAPLMLISISGNTLVLVALLRTPSIHSPSMIMLGSLAFSDLLVGFIAQPLYIADELKSLTMQEPLLYRLSAMIGFFVCGVSLGIITAISVDRFLALDFHMRYAVIVTKTRVKYTVGIIWLMVFLSLGFYLWNKYIFHLMAGILSVICIMICTFSYIRIYFIARRHQLQIHTQQQAVVISKLARLKKSAMSTFVFYICMMFCYFPHFVLLTMFGTLRKEWTPEWTFSTTVVFLNSSINPFLYCWRLRGLRQAIVKTTKQLLCRSPDGN